MTSLDNALRRVAELEQQVAELQRQLVQQDQRFERGASDRVESRMLSSAHHLSPLETYSTANPDQYIRGVIDLLTREVLDAAKSWMVVRNEIDTDIDTHTSTRVVAELGIWRLRPTKT